MRTTGHADHVQAVDALQIGDSSSHNVAARDDAAASFTWRQIEEQEAANAGGHSPNALSPRPNSPRPMSPHVRASLAMQALRPSSPGTRPQPQPGGAARWKSHSAQLVQLNVAQHDAHVGPPSSAGSDRLPIRDPSMEEERMHLHSSVQSLPGTSQDVVAAGAPPVASKQHRRHSTLGLVSCHEKEGGEGGKAGVEGAQQAQEEQKVQPKALLGQEQQQQQQCGGVNKAENVVCVQAFASSFYTTVELPKPQLRGKGAVPAL